MANTANMGKNAPGVKTTQRRGNRLSLSVRFSLLMLLAALLPLAAVVGVTSYFARQTLINQGTDSLTSSASVTASRIDEYLQERLLDGFALSTLDTAPKFVTCVADLAQVQAALAQGLYAQPTDDCAANAESYTQSVGRALVVGTKRDPNYTLWNMYAPNGALLLSSDQKTNQVLLSGGKEPLAPKQEFASVVQGKQNVSPVYYDASGKYAYVRIYTPIFQQFTTTGPKGPVVGFLQATLKLDKIWGFVEQGAKSKGDVNGAFITDDYGVRIADTNSADLFTAVRPLDAATQSAIASLGLYGGAAAPKVQDLPAVASAAMGGDQQTSFQGADVAGGQAQYQFAAVKLKSVPWTYFVDSPIATVTAVATQQVKQSIISAAVVAVLAALIGLFIGSRTARPVETSAIQLEGAASTLKSLASRQESAASEQHWVVDACKTGIDGVRYLADAMNQAAQRIMTASNWFNDNWNRLTEQQARATVHHLRELAAYIDEAARRQQASSDRLDRAIAVTMQVSDQLLTGATEATESAEQLELVVRDLQRVVGGRVSAVAEAKDEAEALQRRMDSVTGVIPAVPTPMALPPASRPAIAPPSGRIAASAPSMQFGSRPLDEWGGANGQAEQYGGMGQMAPGSQYGGMGQMGPRSQYGGMGQMGQMGPASGVNGAGGYGRRGPVSQIGRDEQQW